MAKFSVYVPDPLWDRVRRSTAEDFNLSHLVQRSLKDMLASEGSSARFATTAPAIDAMRMERVRTRYAEQAQAAYLEGYDFGMDLAEALTVDQLGRLRDNGNPIGTSRLVANWEPWAHSLPGLFAVIERSAIAKWGDEWTERLAPGSVFARGTVAALDAVWTYVMGDDEPVEDGPEE